MSNKLQYALKDGCFDPEDFGKEVFNSGWISEGKYDLIEVVIEVTGSNEYGIEEGFYRCTNARSGSYFTDYHYEDWQVEKVEPYTETITVTKYRSMK